MKSKRDDRRGHWPPGKPRNDPGVPRREWRALLRGLAGRVRRQMSPGSVSLRQCAAYVGVDTRSLRWIHGERTPSREALRRIRQWQRSRLKE